MKVVDFWDAPYRDNTDLAVIVAGDMCERLIDIRDYLVYQNDLDMLTLVRQLLLLGAEISQIKNVHWKELLKLRDELLHIQYADYDDKDLACQRFFLQLLQLPFARWGPGCLCTEYSTVDFTGITDIYEIGQILKKELHFEEYKPSLYSTPRLFKIQCD